jgi:dephospho-CoA kinase
VRVIGLTGGIGAGKSSVARVFAQRGAVVIDVDAVGHAVLEPGAPAHDRVIAEFGADVVASDGRIDRGALGRIVFGDPAALGRLTAISYPAINAALAERLSTVDAEVVVLDMAVLVEGNLGAGLYDVVVTVEADDELRVARAVARGMDEGDVRRRMAAQVTDAERRQVADFVIVNDGSEEDLVAAVDRVLKAVCA